VALGFRKSTSFAGLLGKSAGFEEPAAAEMGLFGTMSACPHFGHLVFLPAKSSFTEKAFAHPGQVKAITMLYL
jgi:hypothetical protein